MAEVTEGPFRVEAQLNLPKIDLSFHFHADGWHKVASRSIDVDHPHVSVSEGLNIGIAKISAGFEVEADFPNCKLLIEAKLTEGALGHDKTERRKFSLSYATPLRFVEASFDKAVYAPASFERDLLKAYSGSPPPKSPGRDAIKFGSELEALLRAVLTLLGAGGIVDEWLDKTEALAKSMAAALQPKTPAPAAAGGTVKEADTAATVRAAMPSGNTGNNPVSILVAIGPSASANALLGYGAGGGLLFTSDHKLGVFGGLARDVGFLLGFSAGLSTSLYWGITQPALNYFEAANFTLSADLSTDVPPAVIGATIDFPSNSSWTDVLKNTKWPASVAPCGMTLFLGAGIGIPFEFYAANTYTWVSTRTNAVTGSPSLAPSH